MAEIVELQAYQRDGDKRRQRAVPAEVVIFPGVRIERQTFSLADRLAKPREVTPRAGTQGRLSTLED